MELKIGYAFQNIMKSNNKQKYSKKIQKRKKKEKKCTKHKKV